MKPISATPHGVLDYGLGLFLMNAPWIFRFNDVSAATYTMVAVGLIVLAVSLFTNYPLGLVKAIPFKVHGSIETVGALMLLASPWIMGYADFDVPRNLAVFSGIIYIGVIALTNYSAYQTQRPIH